MCHASNGKSRLGPALTVTSHKPHARGYQRVPTRAIIPTLRMSFKGSSMTTAQKTALAILFILGLIGAVWVAKGRILVEKSNQIVGLCLDDLEVRQLSALTGRPLLEVLKGFKQAGITHLAISESTLGQLLQTGQLRVQNQDVLRGTTTLTGADPGLVQAVVAAMTRLPGMRAAADGQTVAIPTIVLGMSALGLGYDVGAVSAAQQAGLRIVARPMPDFLYTPEAVHASLALARTETNCDIVLFNGVSVAGGVALAKSTAQIMNDLGLRFGYVELVPQEGAPHLASALKYQIIRTHSISQEEMTKTSPTRGLDRFALAVKERNIRLCYVRLMLSPQRNLPQANSDYVKSISDAVREAGLTLGDPQPFKSHDLSRKALVLLAFGVVGGGLWLLMIILALPQRWFWSLLIVGSLIALAGPFAAFGMMRTAVSLLAAVIFPTLSVLWAESRARTLSVVGSSGSFRAVGLVVLAVLFTVFGGLLLAGSLSSLDYMMQVSQFRGVKLAQLLPLAMVLAVTLARTQVQTPDVSWTRLKQGWRLAAEAVVHYWQAVAIFLVLGIVAFMLMRSGNDSGVEVSGFELKLRAFLDQILLVRPRTKEFVMGYPALLLGLSLLLHRHPRTSWVWLTLGTIGVISATNTFCHLHTPLPVSLLRVVNGLWVGILVGLLWLAAKWLGERLLARLWWNDCRK